MNDMKVYTKESTELLQLVSFKIGSEEFGVDIQNVHEINRMLSITQVPNAPEFIEGIVNLRGHVLPVIDLRIKFGLQKKEHDRETRIVVVDVGGKNFGFVVDSVSEVKRIPRDVIEDPPEIVAGIDSKYITAVAKLEENLLILIDLDKLLRDEEKALAEKILEQ